MPPKNPSNPPKNQYSSLVPAVEQASRILVALANEPSGHMNLTEVCAAVGIHKSKGYSILNTLAHFAFVRRSPQTKAYSLGPGLLFLSSKVLRDLDVRDAAGPILRRLAEETAGTAFFGLISEGHVFVVAKDEGTQDMGVTIRLGHRFPLAWGAHGKAIAAFMPRPERDKVLNGPKIYFHGSPSRFEPARLDRELAECRRTGFAVDLGEMKEGIHAVASPVFGPGGKLIGSLCVVGTFPPEMVEKHGSQVAGASAELSELIGANRI